MTHREITVRLCEAYIKAGKTVDLADVIKIANYIMAHTNEYTPYYTSITSESAVLGDGKLLKYTFDIDRSAPEETYEIKLLPTGEGGAQNIPLEFIDANREPVGVNVDFGSIKVSKPSYIPGDANGDGEIDIKDIVLFAQYLAGWNVEVDTSLSDCNSDGKTDIKDVVLLAQYLAGWDITLG